MLTPWGLSPLQGDVFGVQGRDPRAPQEAGFVFLGDRSDPCFLRVAFTEVTVTADVCAVPTPGLWVRL